MEPTAIVTVAPTERDEAMRKAILCLILAIAAALVGFAGVPESLEGLVQLGFFALLVVFVVLMVSHLAEDR